MTGPTRGDALVSHQWWLLPLVGAAAVGVTGVSVVGFLHNPPSPSWVSIYRFGHTPLEIGREVVVAWAFIVAGMLVWQRRPRNRVGYLMVAVGIALLVDGFQFLPVPPLVSLGLWLGYGAGLAGVLLGLLVLVYPSGRTRSRLDLFWLGLAALYMASLAAVATLTPTVPWGMCTDCRPAWVLVRNEQLWWDAVNVSDIVLALMAAFLVVILTRRWVKATTPARRSLAPLWLAGAVVVLVAATSGAFYGMWAQGGYFRSDIPSIGSMIWGRQHPVVWAYLPWVVSLSLLLVPLTLLWGLLRLRLRQSAVGALAAELGRTGRRRPLVAALRRALGDPSLELAFWSRPASSYVNLEGEPVQLPERDAGRAVTRLDADDGPLAVLIHDTALAEQRPLVDGAAAVARLSIENERLHAEVRAQLEEVRASRERIVRAADDERRRVERNIHDGAQQRLVGLSLALSVAQARAAAGAPELAETIAAAEAELRVAIGELRELARGIHPAILTEAGLGAALESLADHAPIPVRLQTELAHRLAPSVEAAAYFVAAEGLANVVKHAAATSASLQATIKDGWLRLIVADDGVGGADPTRGSGLRGLLDRVAALGGRLSVEDAVGGGTRLIAELPCG